MYHYFYKITNNVNGHFYYGVHSTSNLNDGYMGSGSRLHIAYKKYGIENFTKEILKFFNSRNEAFNYESDFVNEELILNNDCYNIKEGGKGWSNKGLFTAKDKFGNCFMISKDDPRYLNGELVGLQQGFIPVKSSSGKIFMISKDDPRYLSGELKSMMYGKVRVRDNNGNIFSVEKNDPRYISGELKFFRTGQKYGSYSKHGKNHKNSIAQLGEKNSQFGTRWINNGIINKKIKQNELEYYLSNGWIRGKVYKQRK